LTDSGVFIDENRPPVIEQTYDMFLSLFGVSGGAQIQRLLQMAGTTEAHPLLQRFLEVLNPYAIDTSHFLHLMYMWNL
jgi:hypothetical protein